MTSLELAHTFADEIVELRRDLHRIPEIGLDLPLTQARLLAALAGLDLEITLGTGLSSITAVLRGGAGPGPTVLLRGDMDALPVTERVELPYISEHIGAMHACGHDLHMAGLVGAARILHARRAELAGDVVLMFQPGEEGPGGAPIMIAEGLLEASGCRVDAAYTLHVTAAIDPLGVVVGRPGPIMAAADTLIVRVVGEGGHGSQPFRAKDPVPATCEMVLALQAMVTRKFDVFDPVVITVGRLSAGTKDNIIGDDATFEATVRSFSAAARALLQTETVRVVEGIAAAHGLTAEVEYQLGYPVTVNDPTEYAFAAQTARDLFGDDRYATWEQPEAGSEDFAFVLEQVPGAYVFLGACVGDPATAPNNHSPLAAFDDAVVPDAAALLAELAVRRLARG